MRTMTSSCWVSRGQERLELVEFRFIRAVLTSTEVVRKRME